MQDVNEMMMLALLLVVVAVARYDDVFHSLRSGARVHVPVRVCVPPHRTHLNCAVLNHAAARKR